MYTSTGADHSSDDVPCDINIFWVLDLFGYSFRSLFDHHINQAAKSPFALKKITAKDLSTGSLVPFYSIQFSLNPYYVFSTHEHLLNYKVLLYVCF